MATVTNTTDRELLALDVEGVDYYSAAGDSLEVGARTALLLREAGWTMTATDQRAAIAADDEPGAQPVTEDETRFTGGRHHRSDDPRANVPGTPVEVTGDTGSPTNVLALKDVVDSPDTPGVPAVKGRARRGQTRTDKRVSVEAGHDLTVKVTPQEDDAEALVLPEAGDVDVSERPLVTSDTQPGQAPAAEATLVQVDHTVATGEAQQQAQGGAVPPGLNAATAPVGSPEYDARTTEMLDAISALRGAALDDAMDKAGLSPLQKTRDQKLEELRAQLLADRQG